MTAVVSALTKKQLYLKLVMLQLIEKIRAYFHSNMTTQRMIPAQGVEGTPQVILMRKPFGVQHLLMLIQICKHGVSVMTCVHLKVQFRFYKKATKIFLNVCVFLGKPEL